ncbi:MAG: hypothetical protein IJ690_02240 [Clostridia bacterium]|nr:hypothetical protein [Clostridia bacterium]
MKKVLIATTNIDKFKAVSKVFENTIFPKDEYIIESLSNIQLNQKDEKEVGTNLERARTKAINAFNALKESDYNYDYVVGLDDALRVKGVLEANIKQHIDEILYGNYFSEGEEYAFNRAYVIIDKNMKMYETSIDIPYVYHKVKEKVQLKEHTYQLAIVAYPLGSDKPICDLDEKDEVDYYLRYVKEGLLSLGIR